MCILDLTVKSRAVHNVHGGWRWRARTDHAAIGVGWTRTDLSAQKTDEEAE